MWNIKPRIYYKGSSGMGGGGGVTAPINAKKLPQLTGSEKQVAWAESIRNRSMFQFNDFASAAEQVLAGKGADPVRPGLIEGDFVKSNKAYVEKMARRLVGFMDITKTNPLKGPKGNDKLRDALNRMRNNFMTQNTARYWIDHR